MRDSATLDSGDIGPAAQPAIQLRNVGYRSGNSDILCGIDLAIVTGVPIMLLGPNGSGKTTLLRLMMGLIAPSGGQIEVAALNGRRAARRAFVFQKPVMLKRSAAANVAFALSAAGFPVEPVVVAGLLQRVGLASLADRPARQLSGGEQQRLALARALAREPDILFLDEPTASLDPAQSKAVEVIIAGIAAAGVTVVMATHDLGQARRLAGDVVFLVGGRVVEQTLAAQFFAQPKTSAARRFLAGDLVI